MANPAPTINQINAFNATQGTTIDFNIIGGTELVRSNRIYIYDLSDNSLICTHLYVSTESIHELPPNTDGSIVYESGKSSADFVNGAQYYAQIQTFTDIGGTEGGSGLSVAKLFWCLVDPTLTITTIPSTISTTSYNVSATYDANTSVVSNIIQQYQFNLYSATGSLLQSSGVVVGSGEQQGTSTEYDISYNFTGLSVGSSYYVVVDVTTTQGMSVSTQSGTFTVSIDTPTLGEATVVNNACDGYISVTSNLSSEYGGSGSGEIVSFETDSENVFTKLQVDLDPIQDLHGYDKPWVGGAGKNLFEPWSTTYYGVTFTPQSDGTVSISGTITSAGWLQTYKEYNIADFGLSVGDSVYCYSKGNVAGDNEFINFARFYDGNGTTLSTVLAGQTGTVPTGAVKVRMYMYGFGSSAPALGTVVNKVGYFEFGKGSTIPTQWTPYSNICPISGHDEVDVSVVGKNLLPPQTSDYIYGGITWTLHDDGSMTVKGTATANSIRDFGRGTFKLKAGTYTTNASSSNNVLWAVWRNSSPATLIKNAGGTFTIDEDTDVFVRAYVANGTTVDTTIYPQLEKGTTATTYEPYNGQTHNITWQTEAGTVYGGSIDLVSGVLTVDRAMVDLGTFSWRERLAGSQQWLATSEDFIVPKVGGDEFAVSDRYQRRGGSGVLPSNGEFFVSSKSLSSSLKGLLICDTKYTTASDFKEAVTGSKLVHTLATPQEIQLTPHQIQTLVGVNNVWSEQGDIELSYHIPITNLLVKRQDVDDVSGNWLALYSQPITQASDMDFTFIDFLNQYGKTYKYALVPLLTQTQSGVEVEVEGGYTVSDEVQSIFDGVFISDSTGSQKCKANVGYGNVNMNQSVGSITPIGSQYPIIVTNSNNRYHNGSISGMIVPDDYYYNGNLSRIDMVNKRNELEQFLTNKRAKIIKDWNSNIWLVMIMDNIDCSFDNNYGMGIVTFNANWLEVGDPTNQEDLQATGLVDVGGV